MYKFALGFGGRRIFPFVGGGGNWGDGHSRKVAGIIGIIIFIISVSIPIYIAYYDWKYPEVPQKAIEENYKIAQDVANSTPVCKVVDRWSYRKYSKSPGMTVLCGTTRMTLRLDSELYEKIETRQEVYIRSVDKLCRWDWEDCLEIYD